MDFRKKLSGAQYKKLAAEKTQKQDEVVVKTPKILFIAQFLHILNENLRGRQFSFCLEAGKC